MTTKHRLLVEFLSAEETDWTTPLSTVAFYMFVIAVVGLAMATGGFVAMMVFMLFIFFAASQFAWPGIRRTRSGGTFVTHWVNMPIGFVEVFRAVHHVSFYRTLLLTPLVLAVAIACQIQFAWPAWSIGAFIAGLFMFQAIVPTWITFLLVTNNGRMPSFRWRHVPRYVVLFFTFLMSIIGLPLCAIGIITFFQPARPVFATALLISGTLCLVGGASLVRHQYSAMSRNGLIDWVTMKQSPFEERGIQTMEQRATWRFRSKLARRKFGMFWWVRPRLWKWCEGKV